MVAAFMPMKKVASGNSLDFGFEKSLGARGGFYSGLPASRCVADLLYACSSYISIN